MKRGVTMEIVADDIATRIGRALMAGRTGDYEVIGFLAESGIVREWTRGGDSFANENMAAAMRCGFEVRLECQNFDNSFVKAAVRQSVDPRPDGEEML